MIIFATQDPERILGLPHSVPSLALACIRHSYAADQLEKQVKAFFCLEDHADVTHIWTTDDLLKHPKTQDFIKKTSNNVMVFKNIPKIQKLAEKKGWNLINNHCKFNQIFEDKIEFAKACQNLQISTPKTLVSHLKNTDYNPLKAKLGSKFVVQFRRGHAGDSTHFIKSEKDWQKLTSYKSEYPAKITQFISGPTLTYNICIVDGRFLYSRLMYQINAYPHFNNNEGGTCGIDIEYAKKYRKYEPAMRAEINKLAEHLRQLGYKGLFGIDLILSRGKVYIIECNPRFTSNLALNNQLEAIPLMANHIKAFLPRTEIKKSSKKCSTYLILRNNSDKPVIVKNAPKSGKYTMDGQEYWLISEPSGSLISQNNKLASIITKDSLLSKTGTLKNLAHKIQAQFKLKDLYISPLDFWRDVYAKPQKALIDVFKKPLKNYEKLSANARSRNRQTQCRQDEGGFELLGEYNESYLIHKWDDTYGWVNKADVKKSPQKALPKELKTTQSDFLTAKQPTPGDIQKFLKQYLGTTYLWGGISHKGIDCSGLIQRYFLELFGLSLPKHSRDQMKEGKTVLNKALIKQANSLSQPNTGLKAKIHTKSAVSAHRQTSQFPAPDGKNSLPFLKKLKPHDLLFLQHKKTGTSHVGVFLDGKLLHASLGQETVMQQELKGVFKEYDLVGVRRIL